jgi:hypothetical protein
MWREPEEIVADLESNDAERIGAGIQDLKEYMDSADEFELPPLSLAILAPFGDSVPEETQSALFELLANYRAFVPPLSPEERLAALLGLLLRYGEHYIAYKTALELKIDDQPEEAVAAALAEVAHQGLHTNQNASGAEWLVSYLLDGKEAVRQATLRALARWPNEPPVQRVIDAILPELTASERDWLRAARG